MLRRVIRINDDGSEVLDESGNYVYEEIEIPNSTFTEENTTDDSVNDDSLAEVEANIIEDTNADQEIVDEVNEVKKLIQQNAELKAKIELLYTQLNLTDPIEKIQNLTSEQKQKVYTSLGLDLKNIKIN